METNSINTTTRSRSISPLLASKGRTQQFTEPVLLIDMDQDGKFVLSKKALQFISDIKTNVAVISVIGQYRTGKSFLLNRFAGQQKGFAIGPSTNPCTKGLWIWGDPIQISDNLTVLLIDTEGINSYQRDENSDAKLFTLTALLSSTLIYNVMGMIDERALETLSFVTNLTKYIQAEPEMDQYLPNFAWVIRDFSLQLDRYSDQSINAAQVYLENALMLIEGSGQEIQQKNDVRAAILKYFKNRQCYTLIRPVHDEKLLSQIDQVSYQDLRKEFRYQVESLIKDIMGQAKPKVIKDSPLQGKHLAELIFQYVQTINNQGVPCITYVWDRIIEKEYRTLVELISQQVKEFIMNQLAPNMPMPTDFLIKNISSKLQIQQKQKLSQDLTKIILDCRIHRDKQVEALINLQKSQQEIIVTQMQENVLKSKRLNNIIANKMIEVLNKAIDMKKFQTVDQLMKEISNLKKIYFQEAQDPTAHEVYSTSFSENLNRLIERLYQSQQIDDQSKLDQKDNQIVTLQAKNETLSELLASEKETLNKQLDATKKTLIEERNYQEQRYQELQTQYDRLFKEQKKPEQGMGTSLFKNPTSYISQQETTDNSLTFKQISSSLNGLQDSISKIENLSLENYKEQYKLFYEKKFLSSMQELKEEYDKKIEHIKQLQEAETKVLKSDRKKLEQQREQMQIQLIERECQLKIYKEKIKSQEKQQTKEVEHADMLCKVSEQMIKLMRKMDNR